MKISRGGGNRFGLTWPGKLQAIRAAQAPTTATLAPDIENSVNWDDTQNVVIEGDNLEVLKILQKHYYGKIKMIYIDVTAPTWIQGIGCLRVDAPRRTWDHEKARPGKYLVGPSTLVLAA